MSWIFAVDRIRLATTSLLTGATLSTSGITSSEANDNVEGRMSYQIVSLVGLLVMADIYRDRRAAIDSSFLAIGPQSYGTNRLDVAGEPWLIWITDYVRNAGW